MPIQGAMVARRTSLVLAGAALLAALLLVALAADPAHARRHAPVTAVGVSAREFRLAVYRTRVPAGRVRFNVANDGEDVHDLVILDRRGRRLARTPEIRPDRRASVLVRLTPGRYRLICDIADHRMRGMHATLRVVERRRR